MENSAGFKIDTGYIKDPMDKEEKQAGQGFRVWYVCKTGADGTTAKVGTNIPTRGKSG